MSEVGQREIAENLFGQTREEIKDAVRLEDERRAALVKNLVPPKGASSLRRPQHNPN
jgi:hypothetical protein